MIGESGFSRSSFLATSTFLPAVSGLDADRLETAPEDGRLAKRNAYENSLMERLRDSVAALGATLIDLRLLGEHGKQILRLYIDKRGGVGIDDCEAVSRAVDPLLDAWGETRHDFLEVQSPGLEHPLENAEQAALHTGEQVDVHLYQKKDGAKDFSGTLLQVDSDGVSVGSGEVEAYFSWQEMSMLKRHIKWS